MGLSALMVLDPSLFEHPVTVQELQQRLLTDIEEEKPVIFENYYGSKYQSHMREAEEYKNSWGAQYLKDVRETLNEFLRHQDDSSKVPATREYKEGAIKPAPTEALKRLPSTEAVPTPRRRSPFRVDRMPFL